MVPPCAEKADHTTRASAFIRRTATLAGLGVAAVAAVSIFLADPAHADPVDYDEATADEIADHLDELEGQRETAAEELDELNAERDTAQAVIDAAAEDFGSIDSQFSQVIDAVDAAQSDLSSKVSSLVGFGREQADRYDEAQEAADRLKDVDARIAELTAIIDDLDDQVSEAAEAREAAEAAEAAAAEAAAEAAARAEASASEASNSDSSATSNSGSSGSAAAEYSSDAATAAVQFAHDQLGKPYVFGSAGPGSYDCSGLVKAAYAQSGIALSHNTNMQWNETRAISRDELRPGDLIFYNGLGHMAIYIGDGQIIHATKPGDVVKIAPMDVMSIDGYRRV